MTTREEVADLIYRNQYRDPTSPGIQPLAERPLREREMIFRGADKLMPLLAKAWEEGAEAAIRREHAYGASEKAKYANPYTVEAQVNGL